MMPVRRSNQTWLPSIFNDFFDNDWMVKANATAPAINVIESDKDYKVEVAAPDGMCDLAESNQKRYSLSSEKEKSLGRSPAWSDVWNSHQTGTRSSIRSASPSGRHSFER